MRAAERRVHIERELAITGEVGVSALAAALSVSPVSIRRDLDALVAQGVARRSYGRAVAVDRPDAPAGLQRNRPPQRAPAGTVGLVVPSSRYYYMRIVDGIKEAAATAQVPLIFADSGYSVEREQEQIHRVVARGISALVVTPAHTPERDSSTYRMLQELPVPVVLMERDGGDEFADLDSVRSDHALGARIAFQHLADLGHRAVALVCAESTATAGWLQAGFETKRELFDAGRSEHLAILSAPEYEPEMLARVETILDRFASRGVTGALVHSDVAAGALAQRARERGVAIPAQLDLIAYDDEIAALADPSLDAIAPPKGEVGREAFRLAVQRMLDGPADRPPQKVTVAPRLVLRSGGASSP